MKTLELNGNEYPFAFTYKCFRTLAKKATELDELDMGEDAWLLAINKGYEREGSKTRIKKEHLIQMIDDDPSAFKKLKAALEEDMEQFTEGEGK